jgi:S1-C subfamily serine protease
MSTLVHLGNSAGRHAAAHCFPSAPTPLSATDPTMRPLPTLLALVAAAAFGGFAANGLQAVFDTPARAAPLAPAVIPAASGSLPAAVNGQPMPSLAPMLQRVMPAVVNVYSRQTVKLRSPMGPFADDPVFRRMLGIPDIPRERVQQSLGSGVIIDAKNGYIITNHHVIENADGVSVTLSDGRSVEAEFKGSDPDTDVALIRIPPGSLTEIPLADSSALSVGDFVVAVGNPFGLGQTVTSGIVSAVGRSGIRGLGYQNFIQTDASINPGNSGGALVNLKGELVGINSAILSRSGGNIGIGFAIPVNMARSIMDQLIKYGSVKRGLLGVNIFSLTPDMANRSTCRTSRVCSCRRSPRARRPRRRASSRAM